MIHPAVKQLHPESDGIAVLTSRDALHADAQIADLINQLGHASSSAQGLIHVITTFSSFTSDSSEELYILVDEDQSMALGFVKVGPRHLFLWDRAGTQHELQPLCLLDFFTHPSQQRKGYGRKMIDRVLNDHKLEMKQIPIDRPSHLCLAFMKKHFGLKDYVRQANNFVVFDEFWISEMPPYVRRNDISMEPRTPVKHIPKKAVELSPHASTPGRKRTGLNPITWQPYDD